SVSQPGNGSRDERKQKTVGNRNVEPRITISLHGFVLDHWVSQSAVHISKQFRIRVAAITRLLPAGGHVEKNVGGVKRRGDESHGSDGNSECDNNRRRCSTRISQTDEIQDDERAGDGDDHDLIDRVLLEAPDKPEEGGECKVQS